jgi:hypothetical protein
VSCPACEAPRGRCAPDCPSWDDLRDTRAEEDAADALRWDSPAWRERVAYEREDQAVHEPYEREEAA